MATRGLVANHPDDGQRFGPEHALAVSVIPPVGAAALCIKPIAMLIEHRRKGGTHAAGPPFALRQHWGALLVAGVVPCWQSLAYGNTFSAFHIGVVDGD